MQPSSLSPLQCLVWSSPLDSPLCMWWRACTETHQRWVLGSACSSSFRLVRPPPITTTLLFVMAESQETMAMSELDSSFIWPVKYRDLSLHNPLAAISLIFQSAMTRQMKAEQTVFEALLSLFFSPAFCGRSDCAAAGWAAAEGLWAGLWYLPVHCH